jgi:hypothetical protein
LQIESMKSSNLILAAVFACLCQIWPSAGFASPSPDCEAIAARLGAQAGLPEGLLPAISRIESGRSGKGGTKAWPWTLNTGGQGHYFETSYDAMDFLQAFLAKGQRNVDIGCMQINYRWHSDRFPSVAAMMDPEQNIAYAIEFLKTLRAQTGSWSAAVQRYHSNDPDRGVAYHAKFLMALNRVQDGRAGIGQVAETSRPINNLAKTLGGLFAANDGAADGPLVPMINAPGSPEIVDAYAHLLAVLAVADAALPATPSPPVVLVNRLEGGEIGRRWQDVESFRIFFRDQPKG